MTKITVTFHNFVNVSKKGREQNTLIRDRILKINERVKLSHRIMKMHFVDVCACMYIAMNYIMICVLTNSVQNKHCNKLYQDVSADLPCTE